LFWREGAVQERTRRGHGPPSDSVILLKIMESREGHFSLRWFSLRVPRCVPGSCVVLPRACDLLSRRDCCPPGPGGLCVPGSFVVLCGPFSSVVFFRLCPWTCVCGRRVVDLCLTGMRGILWLDLCVRVPCGCLVSQNTKESKRAGGRSFASGRVLLWRAFVSKREAQGKVRKGAGKNQERSRQGPGEGPGRPPVP